jgi:hypothetical protein
MANESDLPRLIRFGDFLGLLFTSEEQVALVEHAMSNSVFKLWYDRHLGDAINLDDEDTISGLDLLVSSDVVSAERAVAVLAGERA